MSTVALAVENSERLSVPDCVSDRELSRADVSLILELAERVKASPGSFARALKGRQLALIFEKPSLRTRVTFEVAMNSMGGHAIYLDHAKPRLGERESIKDIAKNLERWVDGIVARTFAQLAVDELAEHASIPVINALTDTWHPCQALGDFMTLGEKFGRLKGLRMAFVGDGNNVCHSLMVTGAKLGVSLNVATPAGFEPKSEIVEEAKAMARKHGGKIHLYHDPAEAVAGVEAVYTDVWASMGQEYAAHLRSQVFAPFQVNEGLMSRADSAAVFMHCLPAHRGLEVSEGVMDSPRSIVYEQAENRLHVEKALLILLLENGRR
jgi:ornithine carbamoyltransferase